MKCTLKNRSELISDYLMGELPDDDAKVFEEHYFQCETCFKELKIAEDAINLLKKEGAEIFKPERKFSEANRKLFFPGLAAPLRWGIAFSSIVILAIVIYFLFQSKQETINEKIITQDENIFPNNKIVIDSLEEKNLQPNNDLAELNDPAFKSNPYFEDWITENVRSVNNNIDTVLSPGIGEKFQSQNITFEWRMIEKEIVSLKIMTNLEEEIFIATPEQSQSLISTIKVMPKVFKQPGLYYWRLEDENEVLYMGKFYFIQQP